MINYKKIKNEKARRALIVFVTPILYIAMILFLTVMTIVSLLTFDLDESVVAAWPGVLREDIPGWIKENW
ncbi:hypothetical protein PP935_gp229 [Rhizobium phage RHph_N34]|uniref:Uncharacterized protein n=1 Tax=Rhizobium phage RHph_N34 TaxID=2509586 RepID=A0A7S5UYK3_9CAUD|nr:hypothetical protein PP935_gp229 [Rhizobium phage RHph_N34]QIG74004.1 hypothetical protein EVC06_229 [Rhizobium phage RHph_N34]